MEILFCKVEGPGPLSLTVGPVARIWCFHHRNSDPVSGWEPKPCSKLLQLRQLEIRSLPWSALLNGFRIEFYRKGRKQK